MPPASYLVHYALNIRRVPHSGLRWLGISCNTVTFVVVWILLHDGESDLRHFGT